MAEVGYKHEPFRRILPPVEASKHASSAAYYNDKIAKAEYSARVRLGKGINENKHANDAGVKEKDLQHKAEIIFLNRGVISKSYLSNQWTEFDKNFKHDVARKEFLEEHGFGKFNAEGELEDARFEEKEVNGKKFLVAKSQKRERVYLVRHVENKADGNGNYQMVEQVFYAPTEDALTRDLEAQAA